MIAFFLRAGKVTVLTWVAILIAIVGLLDSIAGDNVSLGILYIVPMMLGALVLRPAESAALALFCAFVRSRFDVPSNPTEAWLRFTFASVSYFGMALFVTALKRNRELVAQHLNRIQKEQELRREAEEQLHALVASSPAAILTLDGAGTVIAANDAANQIFAISQGQTLLGQGIVDYLPVLADALRLDSVEEGFRTAAQCQGRRSDGEIFLAHTWFSSYRTPQGRRLAAIVVDSSEEMRDREEQNLRQLQSSTRITAAAVSHELRNLCGAISLVCSQVEEKHNLGGDEDFQALVSLVSGLQKLANLELRARAREAAQLQEVPLQRVLDDLRIVIEAPWREIGGIVNWPAERKLPIVVADPQGLLQVFLNLAQNSLRAVQAGPRRELSIGVEQQAQKVLICFSDTGPGIAAPERLFQPFQHGSDGTGLGLYVSRAVVRSYGGELRYEPLANGSAFVIELQVVS